MTRVLVTGMSGTGKSTALAELARRGFRVIEADDSPWSEWVPATDTDTDTDTDGEWLWREDRVSELLAGDEQGTLYVSACVANQGKFYDRFDAVVLLSAPAEVILQRVETRTTKEFGKGAAERERILSDLAYAEPLLRATCTHEIDAREPIDRVVEALIAIGQGG